jgi:hypothetical protein
MSEHQLDQVLHAAGRQAQRSLAAALDIERQLAAAKAAAGQIPRQADPAGIPDAPEPGPEDRCAVPVISLRLIAIKLDRALKMARDLTRGMVSYHQPDLGALHLRVGQQDPSTVPGRVFLPRGRPGRFPRGRARSVCDGIGLEYEFAPRYQALRSVPGPAHDIGVPVMGRDRGPGFGQTLACDRVLNRDRAVALDLALGLARDLACELDAAAASGGSFAHEFLLAHDKILELEAVMFRALDLAVALDRARPAALGRDSGITPGHEPEGDASRAAAGACEGADALSIALDRALRLHPVSVLASIGVDVSGIDLSEADIHDLDALGGVTFTAETTWPPGIAHSVHARSREIRSGVYQVHDDGDHGSAGPAIVPQPFSSSPELRNKPPWPASRSRQRHHRDCRKLAAG